VIAELAARRKGYLQEKTRLVKETPVVADGVVGHDFMYTVPPPQGDGDVTRRTRHYLTDRFYYVLTVTSPAGRPLPDDATRFLSSLTFEAVVKAAYARMNGRSAAVPPRGEASRAGVQPQGGARRPETKGQLADSTPEDALKTFLLALAAQDEATLRAVTLPDAEFAWLLRGSPARPDGIARLKARLDEKPMRRLKAGDRVRMPDGESRVIKPVDVREGRVVLWPDGAPLPSRLENVDGHWKVFARPFIAARKLAEVRSQPAQPGASGRPRGPGR
jgi:hypothetical protein